ncbi:MAG: primosomal protein N' [Prevotella sp.]
MYYVDVILPLPLEGLYTYAVPDEMEGKVCFGMRVVVPLGKVKKYVAMAVRVHQENPQTHTLKYILQVLDRQPVLLPGQYKLWQWIAYYYMSPLGDVFKAALPAGFKNEEHYKPRTETYIRLARNYRTEQAQHVAMNMLARADKQQKLFATFLQLLYDNLPAASNEEQSGIGITREELLNTSHANVSVLQTLIRRGILECYQVEVGRLNHGGESHPERIKKLSEAQQKAYNDIVFSFLKHHVTLLHGVTSGGKTEIYIHLIQQALNRNEQVLYLLPEIALTVQMMERLRRVFGNRLGIYHSKYSDAERVEIWNKQLSDCPYDVILGARSALFLPFRKLGLVIVDEEHESSYKQQEPSPRYHARSAAIMLAGMCGAKTLLGTATPSMESYYNAQTGKYGLVELTTRYKDIELPEITVVDVKDLRHRRMMEGPFSPLLLREMQQALRQGKQVILFQNRRGYAPMVICKQCGWVPTCQHCDVSLTLHRNMNQLTCHYCGFTYQVPAECPACGCRELQARGFGTEKIETEVAALFPDARVARMDLDTTRTRNAYERIINDFAQGNTNILIGTQMVSKGLDFANVAVVGILNADAMLNIPDFRAYETAFMMMAQVSGRAGRKGERGHVILQTMNPGLSVVQQVVRNDFHALYQDVLQERQSFHYPPFTHLIYIYLKHSKEPVVDTAAIEMGSRLRQVFQQRVLGPDKPGVSKVKTLHIRKIVLKIERVADHQTVRAHLHQIGKNMMQDRRYASLQIYFDVDPL